MAQSVTAALVGMASKDGKLSLAQKRLFSQWVGTRLNYEQREHGNPTANGACDPQRVSPARG
jgi:hypothetical protein